MRVLHVPYTYYPDPVGGTEVYVSGLAKWQRIHGCEAAVAAPGDVEAAYEHAGIPVWRFPVSPVGDVRELYGEGDPVAAEAFGEVLDEYKPEVVHLHALTRAVSIRLASQAVMREIPLVFNYHTPTVSCSRGTLLHWGATICSGGLDRRACTSCALHAHGIPRPVATLLSALPASAGRQIGHVGFEGGLWTALRMPELIEVRIRAFHGLMEMADRVIVLCEWSRDLLVRNGVGAEKITLSRQGICYEDTNGAAEPVALRPFHLPLRTAYFGRFDATKGAHILVQAMLEDPDLPVQLDLFGVRQGAAGERYCAQLEALIAGDPRIRILSPLEPGEVIPRLRTYDTVLIPSQLLETGPLVVMEAFAARTPVIGSKLGGISELVTHGIDGLLVDPADSPRAWAESLHSVCSNRDLLASLRAGIRPPRRIKEAALETVPLYSALVRKRACLPTTLVC